MTPTPRTDAMASTMFPDGSRWVQIEFARQLERENQTFRAAQKACEDCDAPRVDRIDELERELAEARATHAALYAGTLKLESELDQERQDRKQADIDTIRALGERNDARAELAREKQRAEENGILAHDTAIALATAREALEWARGELGKHTRPSPIDKALGLQPQGKHDL